MGAFRALVDAGRSLPGFLAAAVGAGWPAVALSSALEIEEWQQRARVVFGDDWSPEWEAARVRCEEALVLLYEGGWSDRHPRVASWEAVVHAYCMGSAAGEVGV